MGKVFSLILGIALMMWGVSIITGISLPIFEIGVGAFLILLGIKIIIKK